MVRLSAAWSIHDFIDDFGTLVKDCKRSDLCDKNAIDSGCHNYALGCLLKTNSETLGVIINFGNRKINLAI